MTVDERIKLAADKVGRIVNLIGRLLHIRANNELVVYSDLLLKQVRPSIAANAFNLFTAAMYNAELLGICALWDKADGAEQAKDRDSLPALRWLVDHQEVLQELKNSMIQRRVAGTSNYVGGSYRPSEAELASLRSERARKVGELVESRLREAIDLTERVTASDVLKGVANFRHKHVAHTLVITSAEKRGPVRTPQYGHVKELTDSAIEATDRYYFVLCDSSHSWAMTRENGARCARALWAGCQLNIGE